MIIGISGKIGSGKDTVGKIICDTSADWEIKKYAAKLKQITALLTGCTIEQLEDQEFKKTYLPSEWNYVLSGIGSAKMPVSHFIGDKAFDEEPERYTKRYTYREFLQLIGTEAMRNVIHPDVWINALFADYKDSSNWVITDVRFPNEADAIKERGGIVIRIERPSASTSEPGHLSETALDSYQFDHIVINNGSLKDLVEKVSSLKLY